MTFKTSSYETYGWKSWAEAREKAPLMAKAKPSVSSSGLPKDISTMTKSVRSHKRVTINELSDGVLYTFLKNRLHVELQESERSSEVMTHYIKWLDEHSCGLYMIEDNECGELIISFELETDMVQFGMVNA